LALDQPYVGQNLGNVSLGQNGAVACAGYATIAASTFLFCEDVEISQKMGLSYGFLMAINEKVPEIVGKKNAPSTGPDCCRLRK
jgi:hypothetical protein